MEFQTKDIANALCILNKAVEKRTILPTLSNVLILPFGKTKAKLIRTDLDRAVCLTIDMKSNGREKPILLPPNHLAKFVKKIDSTISIKPDGDKIIAEIVDVGAITFHYVDPDEFPKLEFDPFGTQFTLDNKFVDYLEMVKVAAATDNSRPVLETIYMGKNVLAAANGFRLHVVENDSIVLPDGIEYKLIPLKTINVLCQVFRSKDDLKCFVDDRYMMFIQGNITIKTATVSGNYPDYTQLIPKEHPYKLEVSAPLFISRFDIVDTHIMKINISENEMNITAIDETHDIRYNMKLPIVANNQCRVAMNPKYLKQGLDKLSLAKIELSGETQPIKITGDIDGYLSVVMPMFAVWE